MKIALIGYGKMGKEIEAIAVSRGHEIVLKIDLNNGADLTVENLKVADVAIEFTAPHSAVSNYKLCFEAGTPVVSGTTGWLDQLDEVKAEITQKNGGFFYASNYSLGVNLFFELNKKLAAMMQPFNQYDVEMTEIHHTQKLDEPSGTAITLAEGIFEKNENKTSWTLDDPKNDKEMHIEALREGQVPGTHIVKYDSEVDYLEITHLAKSRKGFAFGAVLAAEFTCGKTGFLGMQDLLKL